MENWFRTDEAADIAGSIRHALRCTEWVDKDPHVWKWIVSSLHSALQGACVCHLTTSAAPLGAVTKGNAEEWLQYFAASRIDPTTKPPKTFLKNLPDLLKAVRKEGSAGGPNYGVRIRITKEELRRLTQFNNSLRNQLTHFEPRGWSIEVSGIPEVASIVARIISDIVADGYAFRHLNDGELERLREDLKNLEDPIIFSKQKNSRC